MVFLHSFCCFSTWHFAWESYAIQVDQETNHMLFCLVCRLVITGSHVFKTRRKSQTLKIRDTCPIFVYGDDISIWLPTLDQEDPQEPQKTAIHFTHATGPKHDPTSCVTDTTTDWQDVSKCQCGKLEEHYKLRKIRINFYYHLKAGGRSSASPNI